MHAYAASIARLVLSFYYVLFNANYSRDVIVHIMSLHYVLDIIIIYNNK